VQAKNGVTKGAILHPTRDQGQSQPFVMLAESSSGSSRDRCIKFFNEERDRVLLNVMIYWLTNTTGSSAHM
jgi:hypothetical protein